MDSDGPLQVAVWAAKNAAQRLTFTTEKVRDGAFRYIAMGLVDNCFAILQANRADILAASARGLSARQIYRMTLTRKAVEQMASLVLAMVGVNSSRDISSAQLAPGGVVAAIYDIRPIAAIDAICLAIKSCNAILLTGEFEVQETSRVMVEIIHEALSKTGLEECCVQYLDDFDGSMRHELIMLDALVSLVFPYGEKELMNYLAENCRIAMIEGFRSESGFFMDKGVCYEQGGQNKKRI